MKRFINYTIVLAGLVLLSGACKDLNDVEATYRIEEQEVITDAQTAEVVLKGVYSQFRTYGYVSSVEFSSALGLTNNAPFLASYFNEVPINNSTLTDIYTSNYRVIQEANLALEKIADVSDAKLDGAASKANFIAEARFIRALASFNLLRLFGEHFDTGSEYGIILRKEPAEDGTAKPRSTVQETYDFILEDLDGAIANLTQTASFRANVDAAQALKAKVLLYMQDYSRAAGEALAVINNTTRSLEADYQQIFLNGINSGELLFGPYVDFQNNEQLAGDIGIFLQTNQSFYAQQASGDPRFGLTGFPAEGIQKYTQDFFPINNATYIQLRLAEVYLIYAEAAARSNTVGSPGFNDAIAKLNIIRDRVDLPAKSPTDKSALLEDIRQEKLRELWGENGEEWFDLVRYAAIAGDVSFITQFKPTVTDARQYIMPMPLGELSSSNGSVVEQNPGYPRTL